MSVPPKALTVLGLVLFSACRISVVESSLSDLGSELEVVDLEEGLWLYRAGKVLGTFGPVTSNGLIVAGDQGVWVIDTPWDDQHTAVLFDWIEEHLGPIRGVVATHYHDDRLGGVAEAHRRGIETWGHEETAPLAKVAGLESPRRTFSASVVLSTGTEAFELFYPGAGHTLDNTVVWFPERRLLFGGCMVKSAGSKSAGYLEDADLSAWPASLAAIEQRYPTARIVVPGHGPPGSSGLISHTLALVEAEGDGGSSGRE